MSIKDLNRTPAFALVHDYPTHWAQVRPEADAVVEGDATSSYADFESLIRRVAAALLLTGVQPGDRVAMMCTPRLEHLAVFMATLRIGAVWLGLNPRYSVGEFAHVLKDAKPRIVFTMLAIEGRSYLDDLAELRGQAISDITWVSLDGQESELLCWSDLLSRVEKQHLIQVDVAAQRVRSDDPALIVYTSGSTGTSKGAMLSHRSIVSSARIQCEHWWAEPLRILNNLPINHVGSAVELACHAIVGGGTNVLMARFDPVTMPTLIREKYVTVIHQVPTMYQLMLEKGKPKQSDLSSLQALIWSGASAPRALIAQLRAYCTNQFTAYGMTETGGEVLYTPKGASEEMLALTVGMPVPQIPLRLGKLDGSGPSEESTGEIQIKGPTMMSGYLGLPEATAEAFTADGWLRTGDIGERCQDGTHRITGRIREMYKSGGYNIYPREVELILELHPAVAMAAVVSVPDPLYGEVGHAWILASQQPVSATDLDAFCRLHLANYKVPKHFHVRSELPMLAIQKLDKVALRKLSADIA